MHALATQVTKRAHVKATTAADVQRAAPDGRNVAVDRSVAQVPVSPDGTLFATCGTCGHVAVWHTPTSLRVRELHKHNRNQQFGCLAWSPDSSQLATGGGNRDLTTGNIMLWDVATGVVKVTLEGHRSFVRSVAWSPDGRKLCSCSIDSRVWNLDTGDVVHVLKRSALGVTNVAWGHDGACVASASQSVTVWDAGTGVALRVLKAGPGRAEGVAWSPVVDMVAIPVHGGVQVWEAATGTAKHTLPGHTGIALAVAWSLEGTTSPLARMTGE